MPSSAKPIAALLAGAFALTGFTGVADAATKKSSRHDVAATTSSKGAETALTGDTKTQAETAALAAVPGGTVRRSSTEDPADASGAAYEVHVTKADGSQVEVLEDASFAVLSVKASTQRGGRRGRGRHGHGGGCKGETGTTGDTAGTYPGTDTSTAGSYPTTSGT
jgi:hypothetical protein